MNLANCNFVIDLVHLSFSLLSEYVNCRRYEPSNVLESEAKKVYGDEPYFHDHCDLKALFASQVMLDLKILFKNKRKRFEDKKKTAVNLFYLYQPKLLHQYVYLAQAYLRLMVEVMVFFSNVLVSDERYHRQIIEELQY